MSSDIQDPIWILHACMYTYPMLPKAILEIPNACKDTCFMYRKNLCTGEDSHGCCHPLSRRVGSFAHGRNSSRNFFRAAKFDLDARVHLDLFF